mmetsp:Transcript_2634/g.6262  ORF Transcript_2634/g.6262 Transcript_2634/m.6262 type:complete len:299 (+) Transcript_2634:941-1837(+)
MLRYRVRAQQCVCLCNPALGSQLRLHGNVGRLCPLAGAWSCPSRLRDHKHPGLSSHQDLRPCQQLRLDLLSVRSPDRPPQPQLWLGRPRGRPFVSSSRSHSCRQTRSGSVKRPACVTLHRRSSRHRSKFRLAQSSVPHRPHRLCSRPVPRPLLPPPALPLANRLPSKQPLETLPLQRHPSRCLTQRPQRAVATSQVMVMERKFTLRRSCLPPSALIFSVLATPRSPCFPSMASRKTMLLRPRPRHHRRSHSSHRRHSKPLSHWTLRSHQCLRHDRAGETPTGRAPIRSQLRNSSTSTQ